MCLPENSQKEVSSNSELPCRIVNVLFINVYVYNAICSLKKEICSVHFALRAGVFIKSSFHCGGAGDDACGSSYVGGIGRKTAPGKYGRPSLKNN